MKDHYHHGNLKHELIETGIQIISEEGFDRLSLRNISKQCGVSHNAIYRHFDNKEQMIDCCRLYVTEALTDCLNQSIYGLDASQMDTLHTLGYAYIRFYKEHPTYFSFLYRNSSIRIVFTMDEIPGNYPPYEVFRKVSLAIAEGKGETKEAGLKQLLRYWSLMHGIISLFISPNVELPDSFDICLKDFF
ncbi:MAG: TetR/AcrR family transcriptional regulator [Eubacteriales bacterium]|nr:TetR/AcrR family transcriptional regulator [Eubacteriales bacterium]